MWLSTRTRPDLACGVATMGRMAAKNPKKAVTIGYALLRYLYNHPGDLHYTKEVMHKWGPRNQLKKPRTVHTIEVFADISYASDDCRSVQGLLICYGGCPISWSSSRQAYVTHSTSEAELTSYCESLVTGRSTEALLAAIWGVPIGSPMFTRIIYGGNMSAITLAKGCGQASWRTRRLRIRSRILRDAIEGKGADGATWELNHLRGVELPADGLTKPLMGEAFRNFVIDMGMKTGENQRQKDDVSRGDSPGPRGGGATVSAVAAVMGSLALAEAADVADGEERDVMWVGAVSLMLLGAVYACKLMINCGVGCIRRMRMVEPANPQPTTSMTSRSGSEQSMNTTSRSGTQQSMNMTSRSGTQQPTNMTSRSGNQRSASMTSQSGTRQSTGMTSRSGYQQSTGMTSRSGFQQSGRMSSRSGDVRDAMSDDEMVQVISDASSTGAGALPKPSTKSSGSGAGLLSKTNSTAITAVTARDISIANPWNQFQHDNKGKGWTMQEMSDNYQKWKKYKMP